MKVQCLEFREGTVNVYVIVNIIFIVNLRSVAIIPLMHSALRGSGDTLADNSVNTAFKAYSGYCHRTATGCLSLNLSTVTLCCPVFVIVNVIVVAPQHCRFVTFT